MPQPIGFTREFAHLVSMLVHRPDAIDEQKQALRIALAEARSGGRALSLSELNRSIADAVQLSPVPPEVAWLSELARRMAAHSVSLIEFSVASNAAELLGVARILAAQAVHGDDGANFDARLLALSAIGVTARLGPVGFVRRPTPAIAMPRFPGAAPPALTPVIGVAAIPPAPHGGASGGGRGGDEHVRRNPAREVVGEAPSEMGDGAVGEMVEAAFTRVSGPAAASAALDRLQEELTARSAPPLLDHLSRAVEESSREGAWAVVVDVLHRMGEREESVTDADVRRIFVITLRRLQKPGILRGVAQLLWRDKSRRDEATAVLRRAGDVGADVLIELLISSNQASERRAYRSAIAACPSSVGQLQHLLKDHRWYVVRNAVDLLGEMQVQEADAAIVATLRHPDARVRRAAASTLARLATPRAANALPQLLTDTSSAVRLQAVFGLSALRNIRSVPALLAALERESDPELQHAILSALGLHPTDTAVERLIQGAQPGSLLSRKPVAFRLASVHALGEAGTPAAQSALRALLSDRDREVRVAVEKALARRSQGVLTPR